MAKKKVKLKTKIKAKAKAKAAPKAKSKAKPAKTVKKASKKVTKKVTKNAVKPTAKKATKIVAKSVAKAKPQLQIKPKVQIDYSKAITPLGDRLVISLIHGEKVTSGGIILLESTSSTQGYLKGKVLAAGHGAKSKKGYLKQLDVKVGDTVLFSEYASTKIKFHDEDLHIVNETEILGVTQ